MSEPIAESIPTSADPRSHRPLKRARGSNYNSAQTTQATAINHLFVDPSKPLNLPLSSSEAKSSAPAPPEIVANVQGSSAGAGSGEFHVYKASRRREYERLRTMDEEARNEEEQEKWDREAEERRKRDKERTAKNREKRAKKKGKGKGGKSVKLDEIESSNDGKTTNPGDQEGRIDGVKKPIQSPRKDDRQEENDLGVAKVVEEVGITIHDDD